jgi:hypothetical protein
VDELLNTNQELVNEQSRLKASVEKAEQKAERAIQAGIERETELKKEVFDLRRMNNRLEMKEVQFRDIIINNAATQQITDQDVIQAFSELRQMVQQLAKSPVFDLVHVPFQAPPDATQAAKHFYAGLRNLSPQDIGLRLRAQIWDILYKHVFMRPIFGLLVPGFSKDKKLGELRDIEAGLVKFEDFLLEDEKRRARKSAEVLG